MPRHWIKRNATLPALRYVLPPPAPSLAGATVVARMRRRNGEAVALAGSTAIITPTGTPTVEYTWAASDTLTSGFYDFEFMVTLAGGAVQKFPNAGYIQIQMDEDVPAAVAVAPPVNVTLPAITGTAQEGQTLTASNGTWENSPSGFAYQWRRGGVAISGATASTYVPVGADVGATITVQVIASNAIGASAPAVSAATGTVSAAPSGVAPSIVTAAAVAVTGTSYESEVYTFTPPVVAGSPTPTVTRVLTLDGVDVTGAMTGDVYVAAKSETARKALSMTYTATNGTAPAASSSVTASVPMAAHVMVALGQSNIDYGVNNGNPYTNAAILANIPITTVNARYIGPGGADIQITQTNVNARQVACGLVQTSQWLNFVAPGKKFVFVDAAESGTSRTELGDDSQPGRSWANTETPVEYAEATYAPVSLVWEWWYANDAAVLDRFTQVFAPFYLGQLQDGSPFTLGTTIGSTRWDHCLWDVTAPLFAKGRGLFSRGHTKWTYGENHHKDSSDSQDPNTASSDVRSRGLSDFWADSRVQVFAAPKGVWVGHYAGDSGHALEADPDGVVALMWPFAISAARLAGVTIHEPQYLDAHEVATDGTYCDIFVTLPNGGTLSTTRLVDNAQTPGSRPAISSLTGNPSYQQEVTGMELERFGTALPRSPVHRLGTTTFQRDSNFPAGFFDARMRGTVTVVSPGFEVHPTHGRVGRIRITPEVPFVNGDKVVPMWMRSTNTYPQTFDATGAISGSNGLPATAKIWLDFPLERVNALRDPAATYKLPGIPVRPFGPIQTIETIAEAPFVFEPRSVVTTAGSRSQNPLGATVFAGTEGMISVWFRCGSATWPTGTQNLMQARNATTQIMALSTASNGRITVSLAATGMPAAVTNDFNPTNQAWNHLAVSWRAGASGWAHYSINGATPRAAGSTFLESALSIRTLGITSLGIGAQTSGSNNWVGEIGHFYINLNQALDLNIPAERAKFYTGGVRSGGPANFGRYGQLLTGSAPTFYFDGVANDWTNVALGGPNVNRAGTLTAGTAPT